MHILPYILISVGGATLKDTSIVMDEVTTWRPTLEWLVPSKGGEMFEKYGANVAYFFPRF